MTEPSKAVVDVLTSMTTRAIAEAARSPLDRALDAFAYGRGTREDIETIARECSLDVIQIHVHRKTPPRVGMRSIALPIHVPGGRNIQGPPSSTDRSITQVSENRYNGVWAAWWHVLDLHRWLERTRPKPPEPTVAELAALLASCEPFLVRAAVGAKAHAQDIADAEHVLPKLREALVRCPKPRPVVSADGGRVDYLPGDE